LLRVDYRARNDRVYSATRNSIDSVARETATPSVIEPAIRTIVTIAHSYRHDLAFQ